MAAILKSRKRAGEPGQRSWHCLTRLKPIAIRLQACVPFVVVRWKRMIVLWPVNAYRQSRESSNAREAMLSIGHGYVSSGYSREKGVDCACLKECSVGY